MKAAVLYKANTPLEVVEVKQEDPRPGEARVKVKAAGVCHSDWYIMNGDWTVPLPMVLATRRPASSRTSGPASPA